MHKHYVILFCRQFSIFLLLHPACSNRNVPCTRDVHITIFSPIVLFLNSAYYFQKTPHYSYKISGHYTATFNIILQGTGLLRSEGVLGLLENSEIIKERNFKLLAHTVNRSNLVGYMRLVLIATDSHSCNQSAN